MGHEIIIHTDRAFGSTPEVSEKLTTDWLEEHGIYYDELWFGPDKTASKCDMAIDDKQSNYDELVDAGVNSFLLNRPWNVVEGGDGRNRVDSIEEFTNAVALASEQGYLDLSLV